MSCLSCMVGNLPSTRSICGVTGSSPLTCYHIILGSAAKFKARSRKVFSGINCCSHSSSCLPRWSGYNRRRGDKGTMKGVESRARQSRQMDGGVGGHLSGCAWTDLGKKRAFLQRIVGMQLSVFHSLKASPEEIQIDLAGCLD